VEKKSNFHDKLFVLGGDDTEMRYIADILRAEGIGFVYAEHNGERARRGDAYAIDFPTLSRKQVWVECRPKNWGSAEMQSMGYHLVDHHNEGDPGYNKTKNEFWEASSIGQVCALLNVEPESKWKFVAAADHCLQAAYSSGCPGINREDMLEFRLGHYREGMEVARPLFKGVCDKLRSLPKTNFLGHDILFLDDRKVLDRRKESFFVTDATSYTNTPFISVRKRAGRDYYKVFAGTVPADFIRKFLDGGAGELGEVIEVFGDPRRNFTGAKLASLKPEYEYLLGVSSDD